MSKRHTRDDIDKFHDYSVYIPTRTIYVGSVNCDDDGESGVDSAMADRLLKNLSILEAMSAEPITIIMNNPGGDWYHGIAIYDAVKNSKCHITMKILGHAMSMGAIILQAADERIISPNSRFMIHYGYMGMDSNHPKIFQKWSDESKKLDKDMERLLLARIHEKHPTFPLGKLQKMLNFDTILSASETIQLGLADKVLGESDE